MPSSSSLAALKGFNHPFDDQLYSEFHLRHFSEFNDTTIQSKSELEQLQPSFAQEFSGQNSQDPDVLLRFDDNASQWRIHEIYPGGAPGGSVMYLKNPLLCILNDTDKFQGGQSAPVALVADTPLSVGQKAALIKRLMLFTLRESIHNFTIKNFEYKEEAKLFLKKLSSVLCEDFKKTVEAKILLLRPEMGLKSHHEIIEKGKMLAINYFEYHAKFEAENNDRDYYKLYEEHMMELQERLANMGKDILKCRKSIPTQPSKTSPQSEVDKSQQSDSGKRREMNGGVNSESGASGFSENGKVMEPVQNDPFIRAIREGKTAKCLQKMLVDDSQEANVNLTTTDGDVNGAEITAAHAVMQSLLNQAYSPNEALKILNLLAANLINGRDHGGFTPLIYAVHCKDIDLKFLAWFASNEANFNAVDNQGNSVVFHAILNGQSPGIIKKILDFGGDPAHSNIYKNNALHMSAMLGNAPALDIFLKKSEKADINLGNIDGCTPLHLLFNCDDLDYEYVLKILLMNNADLGAKCNKGFTPMMTWMKEAVGNPFPALIKSTSLLRITKDIASDSLTLIIGDIDVKWRTQLPPFASPETRNEFAEFISFLIKEKGAKLRLDEDATKWNEGNWERLEPTLLHDNFTEVLKATGGIKWKAKIVGMKPTTLGKLEFYSGSSRRILWIEIVLNALLASKRFKGFLEVCQFLKQFCQSA